MKLKWIKYIPHVSMFIEEYKKDKNILWQFILVLIIMLAIVIGIPVSIFKFLH